MTGSNKGSDFDPESYRHEQNAPQTGYPEPVRHDGIGPTDFDQPADPYGAPSTAEAPGTAPPFGHEGDSTHTFASTRDDDATPRHGMTGRGAPPYDTASDEHNVHDTPSTTDYRDQPAHARPEDRFITGSTISDDDTDSPLPQEAGVAKRGFHVPVVGGWLLGLVRILIGWQFLWAFLDKTFGFGWPTNGDQAWVNGGQPTQDFLADVVDDPNNPLASMFETFVGPAWVDWVFMIGLAGIGIVLVLGLGKVLTWFAAVCGITLYVLGYLAAWPAGHRVGNGVESVATNPLIDEHLLNAVVLLALAACNAGAYLGLAKAWRSRRAFKDA